MANIRYQAKQKIISNKHLKEWNENLSLEKEALYSLRVKQKIEHNFLNIQETTVKEKENLLVKHKLEVTQLEEYQLEIRLAMQRRHYLEKNQL